ncbi:alcohol dehydrogenase class IV [Bradyrhizobium sp. USDA 4486]
MSNMALHHKLCHVLGGTWNLPHAQTHTVLLSHVLAYNAAAAPDAMERIERAMNTPNAVSAILALMQRLGAPMSLEELGMKRADLVRAALLVMELPYHNPRPVTYEGVLALLEDALMGRVDYS